MKIQIRCRSMVLAALAISLLAIAGFPQTAWAGNANPRAEEAAERRAAARGQQQKAADASANETPDANDHPEGATTHGSENGPGGQTCDGDPDDAGGGVYENTCGDYPNPNHQAAPNGAGDGEATGKPCAGCVGNADDKDPPGQAGGGDKDHNNGYECDEKNAGANQGNNGVGFGNPAHTGCTPDDDDCDPTPTQNLDCTEKCRPTSTQNLDCTEKCRPTATQDASCKERTCPAGQVCSQSTPTCVASDGSDRCGGAVAATVLGRAAERLEVLGVSVEAPAVAPVALARTGGFQLTELMQAGLVLALVGLGLMVLGRRRSPVGAAVED